jgi:hypothetical protein
MTDQNKKPEEKKFGLEDLVGFQDVAAANVLRDSTNNPKDLIISLGLLDNFYKKYIDGKLFEDPLFIKYYQQEFIQSQDGIKYGSKDISPSLLQSMQNYTLKYENAFNNIKINDLTKYLIEGFNIPKKLEEDLKKYDSLSFNELKKKVEEKELKQEEKENIEKVLTSIEILKERKLKERTYKAIQDLTINQLNMLYPAKSDKKD